MNPVDQLLRRSLLVGLPLLTVTLSSAVGGRADAELREPDQRMVERIDPRTPDVRLGGPLNSALYSGEGPFFREEVDTLARWWLPKVYLASELAPTLVDSFVARVTESTYVREPYVQPGKSREFEEKGTYRRVLLPRSYTTANDSDRAWLRQLWNASASRTGRSDTVRVRYYNTMDDVLLKDRFKKYRDDFPSLLGVYCHPFVSDEGELVLQYWFFYYFNNWINKHEGDWEHINVVLRSTSKSRLLTQEEVLDALANASGLAVSRVEYYLHHRVLIDSAVSERPVVYVGGRQAELLAGRAGGHDSHGCFPRRGLFRNVEFAAHEYIGSVKELGDSVKTVLLPDVERVDLLDEEQFRKWFWLVVDVLWGYPAIFHESLFEKVWPHLGVSEYGLRDELSRRMDIGIRAPRGPAFTDAWNTTGATESFEPYEDPSRQSLLRRLAQGMELQYGVIPSLSTDPGDTPGIELRDAQTERVWSDLLVSFEWPRLFRSPGSNLLFRLGVAVMHSRTRLPLNPFTYHDTYEFYSSNGRTVRIRGGHEEVILDDERYPLGVNLAKGNVAHHEYSGLMGEFRLSMVRMTGLQMGVNFRSGESRERSTYYILAREGSHYERYRSVNLYSGSTPVSEATLSLKTQLPWRGRLLSVVEIGWRAYGTRYLLGHSDRRFSVRLGVRLGGW